ncbi:DUF3152 domain-containing protein [Hamadaea tsunoensis]|uniref:DUF3152 domain-containing protein n=1 Tax=Hamadaea tsunoensis TaxID=53368 RepID=UPI0003FE7A5B|nr:DUF3152 domain-containing protein [Hamadaea tsunoensis]
MRLRIAAAVVAGLAVTGLAAACGTPSAPPPRLVQGVTDDSTGGEALGVRLPAMPAERDDEGALAATPTAAPVVPPSAASSRAGVTRPQRPLPGTSPAGPIKRNPLPGSSPTFAPPVVLVPPTGTRTFTSANSGTPVVGDGATLVTYRVQVEGGIPGWTPEQFAQIVDGVLADPRSWQASHKWSFQRVGTSVTPSVFVRLATPGTTDYLCGSAGVNTQGIYSCRYGSYVIINLLRWVFGTSGYETNLPGYRAMVTSHEMGHFLGYSHQACPAAGSLAPVMQTQTIALDGCLPNSWPYPDGVHFVSGPPAPA